MKNFTNEQIAGLMGQTIQIINGISQAETTRDVMARLYVENLEDKTMQQGLAMADKILESVKKFDADYALAREDLDRFISTFQDKAEEGKSVCERCNYWLKLAAAVTAAGEDLSDGTVDRVKIMQQLESMTVSEEDATEELAKQLRQKAFEALKNSGILLTGLKDLEAELENVHTADEAAGLLIDLGGREVEYRAIMSMLAYTQVKTGQFEDIPVEMTAAQITTAVCAGVEQTRIAEGVETGAILVDVAAALLAILGTIVIVSFLTSLFLVGAGMAAYLFPTLLAVPACIMMAVGLFRFGATAIKQWADDSKSMVRTVIKGAKLVFRGVKALASFVVTRVFPGVLELGKKLWAWLTNTSSTTTAQNEDEEVEVVEDDTDGFRGVQTAPATC